MFNLNTPEEAQTAIEEIQKIPVYNNPTAKVLAEVLSILRNKKKWLDHLYKNLSSSDKEKVIKAFETEEQEWLKADFYSED